MPLSSPFALPDVPKDATLYDVLFDTLTDEDLPKPAITDSSGRTTTFGELKEKVDAFAGALADRGVGHGQVVGLHCPNSVEFVIAFHGALRAGASVSTISSMSHSDDINHQLRQVDAHLLLAHSAIVPDGIDVESTILLDQDLEALIAQGLPAPDVAVDTVNEAAVIPFSSGTTAFPKGVQLSHSNLVYNAFQAQSAMANNNMGPEDVGLSPLPFFHSYGLTVAMNLHLLNRAHLVTMARFDLEEYLTDLEKYQATVSMIAPPIFLALAKHPIVDKFDTSSLKVVISAAAPVDTKLAEALRERLGIRPMQGYGMTEASPLTHMCTINSTDPGSVGQPGAFTEAKLVDLQVEGFPEIEVPQSGRSEPGEVWVRGPQVMIGYLNNEEATAETITEDGWLRTGDIGELDATGDLFIVDRSKELIKYKGYQVAPAELEALLLTHTDILDAAVVGAIRAEDGEEVPHAHVVLAEGSGLGKDELMEWVAAQVSPYKKIRMVTFTDSIPKSATGKILRRELRA